MGLSFNFSTFFILPTTYYILLTTYYILLTTFRLPFSFCFPVSFLFPWLYFFFWRSKEKVPKRKIAARCGPCVKISLKSLKSRNVERSKSRSFFLLSSTFYLLPSTFCLLSSVLCPPSSTFPCKYTINFSDNQYGFLHGLSVPGPGHPAWAALRAPLSKTVPVRC